MADHAKPILTDNYTDVLSQIRGRFEDQAKGFDPANTTATNIATGTIRWNSAEKKFQKWSGTAWGDLTDNYVLSGATFSTGTANGVAYLNGSKVLTTGSALTFDGANLGIGTNTPESRLTVRNALATGTGQFSNLLAQFVANAPLGDASIQISNGVDNSARVGIIGNGNLYFSQNGLEQMRLTSTGLGIGTSSPATKLEVVGTGRFNSMEIGANNSDINNTNLNPIAFKIQGTERMRLDASGNLGLGVVPSTWGGYKAIQLSGGSIASPGANVFDTTCNAYNNSGWKYVSNFAATLLRQEDGAFKFFNAPSGTAGSTISFTQAMTLNANGNLLVGNTNGTSRITASGVIESTTGGFKFPDGTTQTTAAVAPNTSNVLAATAGADSMEIGTYAMLRWNGSGVVIRGSNVSSTGGTLTLCSCAGTSFLVGTLDDGMTWKCLGYAANGQTASGPERTTLWLRVS